MTLVRWTQSGFRKLNGNRQVVEGDRKARKRMFDVTPSIQIPPQEFTFTYARSSGPGGQNVNKVSSKAVLRWHVLESPSLSSAVRARFLEKFGSRLTKEGDLILQSQRYRDQSRNTEDCLQRLREMLLQVAHAPVKRRSTRRSRGSVERRIQNKKANSARKQSRRRPASDD
jgi:ribosome-associated protein